jgi:hypothetical protein
MGHPETGWGTHANGMHPCETDGAPRRNGMGTGEAFTGADTDQSWPGGAEDLSTRTAADRAPVPPGNRHGGVVRIGG